MKATTILSILTAASASLCCITPALGIIAGTSSLITSFTWIEPFRPYLILSTFLMLGFAWYNSLKPLKKDDCGCETKRSFIQSKKFLGLVTALSLMLLSFPTYSRFLIQENNAALAEDQEKNKKITLAVNGMTCASCEHHIESEVIKLSGVASVIASYENKHAIVEYNAQKTDEDKIIAAINSTGYKVDKNTNLLQEKPKGNCCTKDACTAPGVKVPNEKAKI